MANLEKQKDEILVLQSMFDQNFHLINDNRFEILIDVDRTSNFTIQYEHRTTTVRYLPPLLLLIQYNEDYPSDSPPRFILSCFYLSKSKLTKLCEKLDNHSFINGEVCIFEWIQIIKAEISDEIILDSDDENQQATHDPRALTTYSNERRRHIFEDLISYHREKDNEQFRHQQQNCSICAGEILGASCIRLYRCGHFYCRMCLDQYVRCSLDKGQFGESLGCPQSQCRQGLLPTEIKDILRDDQLYDRYERLTLQRGLETMNDVVWCPRCQQAVLSDGNDPYLAMCSGCFFSFCKKCHEAFHSQTMCPRDYWVQEIKLEQKKALDRKRKQEEEAMNARVATEALAITKQLPRKSKVIMSLTSAQQDQLIQEVLTAERMELLNTQACPGCYMQIEKNGGCSHMHCTRCNLHFTWRDPEYFKATVPNLFLTKIIEQNDEIESIKRILGTGAKPETLPEEIETSTETIEQNEMQSVKETDTKIVLSNKIPIGAAMMSRLRKCPSKKCKKINLRIAGDNCIVCSECSTRYCFVCGKKIVDDKHFGRQCPRYVPF